MQSSNLFQSFFQRRLFIRFIILILCNLLSLQNIILSDRKPFVSSTNISHIQVGEIHLPPHRRRLFGSESLSSLPSIKVAILVIYTGRSWPLWFNTFLVTTQFTKSIYEWIFIVPYDFSPPKIQIPSQVKIITKYSLDDLAHRFVSLDQNYSILLEKNKQEAYHIMKYVIINQPYVLVEFKPTLGYLFQDILIGYSHWAYADIDMILGRMDKLISTDMLDAYDIITTGFGDTYVLYMRGQLTVHKNRYSINKIWNQCEHHRNVTNRLKYFRDEGMKNWPFQSAEGCYSYAVIMKSNATVLIVTSQFSDAYYGRLELRESFLLGKGLVQCYNRPIEMGNSKQNHSKLIEKFLMADEYSGWNKLHVSLRNNDQSTLIAVSMRLYKCVKLYWFDPKYEMCLDELPVKSDVVRKNNMTYYISDERRYEFNGNCREGAISHIQVWKKNYYTHTCQPPQRNSHLLLITDSGLIPYRLVGLEQFSYSYLLPPSSSMSFGRIVSKQYVNDELDSLFQDLITSYCLIYSNDLLTCLSYLHFNQIKIYRNIPKDQFLNQNDVTLIIVGYLSDARNMVMEDMIQSWNGPKILVLGYYFHISQSSQSLQPSEIISRLFQLSQNIVIVLVDLTYHSIVDKSYSKSSNPTFFPLPDKMMFNIGLDIVHTDYVFLIPPGYRLRTFDNQLHRNISQLLLTQLSIKRRSPIAILIPVYTIKKDRKIKKPYPFHLSSYGYQQSKKLWIDYEDASKYKNDGINGFRGDESPQDLNTLLKSSTIMMPVAFRISANLHGAGFIRFAEELNGVGCYGTTILRMLNSAGYDLHWSNGIYSTYHLDNDGIFYDDLLSHKEQSMMNIYRRKLPIYGCRSATFDTNATMNMMKKFNDYYYRVQAVRIYGFTSMNSRNITTTTSTTTVHDDNNDNKNCNNVDDRRPYGFLFEKYQSDRIRGKGDPRKRRVHKTPPVIQ